MPYFDYSKTLETLTIIRCQQKPTHRHWAGTQSSALVGFTAHVAKRERDYRDGLERVKSAKLALCTGSIDIVDGLPIY